MERAKFIYSPLGKTLEKEAKKQVVALKPLSLSNKIDKLKQIVSMFLQNQLNDLIINKLNEITQLLNEIKFDDLEYKEKRRKHGGFSKYSLPIAL